MNDVKSKRASRSAAGARRSFRNFVSIFHGKWLVEVQVYADESGTHDASGNESGSQWLTVSGYVGDKDQFEKLSVRWQRVLDDHGVRVFHMREFVDKRNSANDPNWPYYGW
jgi:hypothetical protein